MSSVGEGRALVVSVKYVALDQWSQAPENSGGKGPGRGTIVWVWGTIG